MNRGTPGHHWLSVRLRGTESNRDAIGARVLVEAGGRTQLREVTTTQGYLAGRSLAQHFGLGPADTIDRLVVHWPSGRQTVLRGLDVDERLVLTEGE